MQIFSRYSPPKVAGLKCPESSLTEQVYKDQCDLNFLIRKYGLDDDPFSLTMYVDPTSRKMQFVDATQVPDLYAALAAQAHLRQMFNELDYKQQKAFDFSVDAFSRYIETASEDDIKKLGLKNLVFRSEPVPTPVPPPPTESQSEQPAEDKAGKQ